MSDEQATDRGDLAERLGQDLMRVHIETYGKGAETAQVLLYDDTIVVFLDGLELLPNEEFMRVLRAAWGAPLGLPASGRLLDLGAAIMRTETELVLKSRRVVPARLLASGFQFRYDRWSDAARDLIASWRRGPASAPCNYFRTAC